MNRDILAFAIDEVGQGDGREVNGVDGTVEEGDDRKGADGTVEEGEDRKEEADEGVNGPDREEVPDEVVESPVDLALIAVSTCVQEGDINQFEFIWRYIYIHTSFHI